MLKIMTLEQQVKLNCFTKYFVILFLAHQIRVSAVFIQHQTGVSAVFIQHQIGVYAKFIQHQTRVLVR